MKKNITHSLLVAGATVLSSSLVHAQLSVPSVENVYGGRINALTALNTTADSTRIFISTESANTLFYSDAYVPASGSPVFGSFHVLPGVDASAGYGSGVQNIKAHHASGHVFFIANGNLLSTSPTSSTVNTVSPNALAFNIIGSTLMYIDGGQFKWGNLNGSANFTAAAGSPIASPVMGMCSILVNKTDSLVYIFQEGSTPMLYVSSDQYTSFSSSTTFSDISPVGLSSSYFWKAFGIAPDGRFFIGGADNTGKRIAYSDSLPVWSEMSLGINGTSGPNFDFAGNSSQYSVYFASVVSDSNGTSAWHSFGNLGFETHPNDGFVLTDPTNDSIVYMTTDQGIGASNNRGANIYEIDNGVEAVQVKDLDMTSDKNTAWIASKSGVRKVTNYQSTPSWTNALFPNGDGSPYYSVAMKTGAADTAFAGNVRVYKTEDGGSNWSMVFTAENAPYNFNSVGVYVSALEYLDAGSGIVFAGYYAQDSIKGGVFYSHDGGSNWNQLLLEASVNGPDVDVKDIIFAIEGLDTAAYIGVNYDLNHPQGMSVYRAVKNGATWNVSQNFDAPHTSVGYQIVATINDLYRNAAGDTLYACGTDAGVNEPHVYVKAHNGTNKWTPLSVSGFPTTPNSQGKAFTIGNDTAYCAVDNSIYYMPIADSVWALGYTYPIGNEINFLYFDALLVGTGTGLYGQHIDNNMTTGISNFNGFKNKSNLSVFPNPANSSTTLKYNIKTDGITTIALYDVMGREVISIFKGEKSKGEYTTTVNLEQLPKGTYIIKLNAGGVKESKVVVKN